jgi:hypothetical protein
MKHIATSLVLFRISYMRSETRINFSFQSNEGGREGGDIYDCMNLF